MIPTEAIEAAAELIVQGSREPCECRRSIFDKHNVNPPCSTRREATRVARAALEAAAPYMLAEAWEQGRDAEFKRSVMKRQADPNPYITPQ